MNRERYDDQTYGSGRDLDHQEGRLYGHMKREPLFLRPSSADFWLLILVSMGVTLLLLMLWAVAFGPDSKTLWLGAAGIALVAIGGSYLLDGLLRWWRMNYRYQYPRDLDRRI